MTDHWSRWPVVVSVASGTLLTGVTLGFGLATGIGWQQFVESYSLTNMVIGLAFLASGAPVAWLTRNVVGPLLVAAGLCHLISATATMMAVFGLNADWPTSAIRALSTFSNGPWQLGIGLLFPLALLLFPDGHLPSRKWAWVAWLIVISGAFQAVTGILADGSSFSDSAEANSILSIGLELPESVVLIAGIASDAAYLLVIGALVWRFIRGDERTRRQLMWLILALLIILALNFERLLTGDGPILLLLSAVLIPVALAIAIVRYELFDIRVVLSRTLLYGLTIALVIAVYVGVVAGLTLLVPSNAQRSVSVAAAIVVAFLFAPLRSLVQRMINRAFYGTRSDPARTAWQIGEGLRHDDDLPGMLEQTRSALRLPWISLRGEPDGDVIATAGTPQGIPSAEIAPHLPRQPGRDPGRRFAAGRAGPAQRRPAHAGPHRDSTRRCTPRHSPERAGSASPNGDGRGRRRRAGQTSAGASRRRRADLDQRRVSGRCSLEPRSHRSGGCGAAA